MNSLSFIKKSKKSLLYSFFFFIMITLHLYYFSVEKYSNLDISYGHLVIPVIIGAFISNILGMLLHHFTNSNLGKKLKSTRFIKENRKVHTRSHQFFMVTILFLTFFICLLPMFFIFCPGILAYDFSMQINEIATGVYSTHHPLAHTLLMQFFYEFGQNIMQSGNIGIALYTVFQIGITALAYTYTIFSLYKIGTSRFSLALISLYFIIFPPCIFMPISATKDSIFTVLVLLFVISFLNIFHMQKNHITCKISYFILGISTSCMILFRNNAIYALGIACIALLTFYLWNFKKGNLRILKKVLIFIFIGILLGCILNIILQISTQASKGDNREMLSIPLQQIARVNYFYHDDLTLEQQLFLEQCINPQGLSSYNPCIADPVKFNTNTDFIMEHMDESLSLYFELGLTHWKSYINAFLIQNKGYLNIVDKSHAFINNSTMFSGLGYIQTIQSDPVVEPHGIYYKHYFPELELKFQDWTTENKHLNIPFLGILMSPGIWFYFFLLFALHMLYKNNIEWNFICLFLGSYYLTLFLGPVVQLRYVYLFMIILPVILIYYLNVNKWGCHLKD